MSVLAGMAALAGTLVSQIWKVIVVDAPTVIATAGQVVLDVIQK